ncbi:MAG: DUF1295 domain-containing protein [Asgard group archaeon]|nr:DUF1295 domain-containing protein [Asgard group archaeon]
MIDWVVILVALSSIFVLLTIVYFFMLVKKNNGLVDIFWSLNFIVAAVISILYTGFKHKAFYITQIVITALIIIWGLRLAIHVARRNIGKPEDRRYKELREKWGKSANVKTFFIVNMLQALWAAIIVLPVVVANSVYPEVANGWIRYDDTIASLAPLMLGFLIWVVGFYFEAIGDRQLKKFVQNPENKGKIIEIGLWKYSRHPNFFGEMTMSWGLFVTVISLAISNPWIWITLIGPIIYTLLIRYVTGVPRLENHLINKPGYREYMERTSVIFPLPQKKKK